MRLIGSLPIKHKQSSSTHTLQKNIYLTAHRVSSFTFRERPHLKFYYFKLDVFIMQSIYIIIINSALLLYIFSIQHALHNKTHTRECQIGFQIKGFLYIYKCAREEKSFFMHYCEKKCEAQRLAAIIEGIVHIITEFT